MTTKNEMYTVFFLEVLWSTLHKRQIANVHRVIIFQGAKKQNCSKLALLWGVVAADKVTEMIVSHLSKP